MSDKLGNYLRLLRGKESLRSVANRTNGQISHSYISDLEKGVSRRGNKINPSPETLKVLSNVYNADYNKLMELAGYSKDKPSESNGKKHYYDLTDKERIDLGKLADEMLAGTTTEAEADFWGKPSTQEQKDNLRAAILTALEINKIQAKKKFTSKK